MRLKNPLYCYPLEADKLLLLKNDGDKKGVRRQIKELGDILPKPCGDEKTARMYRRKESLTKAIAPIAGAVMIGAAAMELSDAVFPADDALFMVCFSFTMLGVLSIAVILTFILSVRRKLVERYLADYTPVCTHFDEGTRKLCGRALLFSTENEELVGEGIVEDGEENEYDFDNCFCVFCGTRLSAVDVTEFSDGSAVCPECRTAGVTFGSVSDEMAKNVAEYAREVRIRGGAI